MTEEKKQPFAGKGDHDSDGKAGGSVKTPKTVPVKLTYDTWIGDKRTARGTVLEVPLDTAKELIAAGKAVRNDPLPGDDA